MTTPPVGRSRGCSLARLPLLLAAVAVVPSLAACGSEEGSTPPRPAVTATNSPDADASTSPGADRISMASVDLVTIETSGGMCADRSSEGTQCQTTTTVAGDGAWTVVDETGTTRTGRLDFEDLSDLIATLYNTDATKHPKDERACDSWVDGRDVTLTYVGASGDDVTVSSCDYDLSGVKALDAVAGFTAA